MASTLTRAVASRSRSVLMVRAMSTGDGDAKKPSWINTFKRAVGIEEKAAEDSGLQELPTDEKKEEKSELEKKNELRQKLKQERVDLMAKTPKHLRPNRAAIRYELAQARLAMKQQLQPKPAWPIEKGGKTVRDYVKEALSELHADEKVDLQTDEALKFKLLVTLSKNFKLDVPNATLSHIVTVSDVVKFFEQQHAANGESALRTTAQKLRAMDLPPNFKVVYPAFTPVLDPFAHGRKAKDAQESQGLSEESNKASAAAQSSSQVNKASGKVQAGRKKNLL